MSYYIIGYIICFLYNFIYMTYTEVFWRGHSVKIKDLFEFFRFVISLTGPLCAIILITEDVRRLLKFVGNIQIRKGK